MRDGPWILTPVRSLGTGKSRLSGILDRRERRSVNEFFMRHAVKTAAETVGLHRTAIVSAEQETLDFAEELGAYPVPQKDSRDLNAALHEGTAALRKRGAGSILITAVDLPCVTSDDLREVIAMGETYDVVVCDDRVGSGTNVLYLGHEIALEFKFGPDSCARHVHEAASRGLSVIVFRNSGTAFDIDHPENFYAWENRATLL